jgi:hypothetical protein
MDLDIMDIVMELGGMGLWEGQMADVAQEDGTVSPISLSSTRPTSAKIDILSTPKPATSLALLCFTTTAP